MKPFCWMAAVLAAICLLAGTGCGGGGEAESADRIPENRQELDFGLEGDPGPGEVGLIMASRLEYFAEAGFDVWLHSPLEPSRPIQYVAGGSVDLSVSHAPEVVLAQEQGAPIVAIASLISQPTAALIWLPDSNIDEVADLKGKTIATSGLSFQEAFLESILARAGLSLDDVEVKDVGYETVPALASGRVDATFGGSANVDGAELEARGLKPVVTPVSELGVPPYDELVVIARRDRLAESPQAFRDILAVVGRGNAAAVADPAAAADAAADESEGSTEKGVEAAAEATFPLLSESGEMDMAQAEALIEWMREEGMVQRELSAAELFTNDYLESQE